jgi:hypothetical protein
MIQFLKSGSIAIALVIGLVGCATEIHNVKDAPVKTLSGKELTLDQATKAIVLAGMGLNWEMDVVTPGHIVGTLSLRKHVAVVDITYDTKAYSITYKKSTNLMMVSDDGTPIGIHPNYNGWIQNLNAAIRTQFVAIGS